MRKLFRLSDPYSLEQYLEIRKVLNNHRDEAMIAYQSNWYVVIACLDWYVASAIRKSLAHKYPWSIDIKPGRKNTIRHYLRIQLLRK